jgi:hypothetical protein
MKPKIFQDLKGPSLWTRIKLKFAPIQISADPGYSNGDYTVFTKFKKVGEHIQIVDVTWRPNGSRFELRSEDLKRKMQNK